MKPTTLIHSLKMRRSVHIKLCAVILFLFLIYYIFTSSITPNLTSKENATQKPSSVHYVKNKNVTVAVVACGDRLQETLTMIKSAIIISKIPIHFIVLAEDNLISAFKEKLEDWRERTKDGLSYQVLPLTFPVHNAFEWRKLFKPCASQRLFLPTILKDVDSLLYVDTDVLFMTPVETVWSHFDKMNSSQMVALAPEHEEPNVGWYNRFARHPYYGPLGVNSGVMLMNLTRMRKFQWVEYVIPIYEKYKLKITFGDQDIINIIFHFHPDKLYLYSCRYNFRPDHCMYMSVCKPAEKEGIAVIHGSRGFFHSEKQPAFQAVYRAFERFQIGGDVYKEFYLPLDVYLDAARNSNCGHIKDAYLKNIKKYVDLKNEER